MKSYFKTALLHHLITFVALCKINFYTKRIDLNVPHVTSTLRMKSDYYN